MRPTKEYIERSIEEINRQCFGGELPMLPVVLSSGGRRLGALSYVTKRSLLGKKTNTQYKMTISTLYDFTEEQIRDTICHEMIHYYIAWKNIRDTSTHGTVFRRMMNDINRRFGYHMTVTHRLTDEELMSAPRNKTYLICISTFKDGRCGLTISARTRLFEMWDGMKTIPDIVSTKWYVSTNPFFGKYRSSLCPCAYIINEEELTPHLVDAKPLVRTGNTISVAKREG